MKNVKSLFDFFDISSNLSEEERLIQQNVRSFVDAEVLPIIQEHYRAGSFPTQLVKKMGDAGYLGAQLSGYGCAGLGPVAYGLIMQELERGDSGIRSFASVQGALCMYPIHAFGTEDQKKKYLEPMAQGELIGCFGLTEPDFGSNPSGMLTSAKKIKGGWQIHGTKMWITNGNLAQIAIIWAKTEEGIRGFIVPSDSKGFLAQEIKGKLSLRASNTAELSLDQVEVADDALLPGTKGVGSALKCLNQARYGIAWGAIGAAHACLEEAISYAKNRIQFDRPIAGFQTTQMKLAHISTEMTKAQLLALQLGRLKEKAQDVPAQISMAKMNNVNIALEAARMARTILGANGILDEYHALRHAMNLESVYTYEGTHDIHNLIIGQELTGIAAFAN